jgi:hypothetical protein
MSKKGYRKRLSQRTFFDKLDYWLEKNVGDGILITCFIISFCCMVAVFFL